MSRDLKKLYQAFTAQGDFIAGEPFGSGHINDTYLIRTDLGGTEVPYVLQRINHDVFKKPIEVMDNMERVSKHLKNKLLEAGARDTTRRSMTLVPAQDGLSYSQDEEGNTWRLVIQIRGTKTYDVVDDLKIAREAAKAFGNFQAQLVDLPGDRLYDTIPNFHNTPKRLEDFLKALQDNPLGRAQEVQKEIDFLLERQDIAHSLIRLSEQGAFPERITHNDTKINNALMDELNSDWVCVIDLDTVMPGLSLYDFGDMIRTATSPADEDEPDLSKVTMRMPIFKELAIGYLEEAKTFLSQEEIERLPLSGKLITYEQALRFLGDHILGDVYYKVHRDNHNLDRARTQIALIQSIEAQEADMLNFVRELT